MTYHAEGVVASYPYTFDVDENDIGTVVAFIYDQMQIIDDKKQEVLNELSSLQTQKDSGYTLMDDKVILQKKAFRTIRILNMQKLEFAGTL